MLLITANGVFPPFFPVNKFLIPFLLIPSMVEIINSFIDFGILFFQLFIWFIIGSFVGLKLKGFLQKKFNLSFVVSVIASMTIIFFIILFFLYFSNWYSALLEENLGYRPDFATPSTIDIILFFVFSLIRVILLSVLFSLILLPFAFIGSVLMPIIKEKINNELASFVIANALLFALGLFIVLFLLPWIPLAMLYLIFFA